MHVSKCFISADCAKSIHYKALLDNHHGVPTTLVYGDPRQGKSLATKCGVSLVAKHESGGINLKITPASLDRQLPKQLYFIVNDPTSADIVKDLCMKVHN